MARLLDRFTDQEIMAMLIKRDFTAVNNVFEDDEVRELGQAFAGYTNADLTLSFPNATKIQAEALRYINIRRVNLDFSKIVSIGSRAFENAKGIEWPSELVLPVCLEIGSFAFADNTTTAKVDVPEMTSAGRLQYMFSGMRGVKKIRMQRLEDLGTYNFYTVQALEQLDLPSASAMGYGTFQSSGSLKTLRLGGETVDSFASTFNGNAALKAIIMDRLTNIPTFGTLAGLPKMQDGTCFIYVPRAMVGTLRTADNWTNYAGQILAVEDHPEVMPVWEDEEE